MHKLEKLANDINTKKNIVDELDSYIKENKIDKLKTFFNSDNDTRLRKELYTEVLKEERKKEIFNLKKLYDELNIKSTFSFQNLTNFLCDVISIMEKETYIKMYFNFSDSKRFYFTNKYINENVCLITSYENMKKIREFKNSGVVKNSFDIMDLLRLQKYILIDKSKGYSVVNKETLDINDELIRYFPYLKNILLMALDLKMSERFTEEEIFNITKESIKPIYIDNCKENEKIKR